MLRSVSFEEEEPSSLASLPQSVLRQVEIDDDIDGSDAEVDWVLQNERRPLTTTSSIDNHPPASVRGPLAGTSDEESDAELTSFMRM
jgi:hypothetical protein